MTTPAYFRPCVIIPCYDSGGVVLNVLRAIEPLGLRCYLVDDGSSETTKEVLAAAATEFSGWLTILRHEFNQGKGVAVSTAAFAAAADGYSHALQIDADGQHCAADAPRFLEAAATAPHALVLGQPSFFGSTPPIRYYGRKLTHLMVWLETASFSIGDALCGYRCYPLGPLTALLRSRRLGRRMDFDPEVLVRLAWAGVPIVNVPTRVQYFERGVSHFRLVGDNLSMVRLHFSLLTEFFLRAATLRRVRASGRLLNSHLYPARPDARQGRA